MHETQMMINAQEIQILLSALQLLELSQENMIAKEHGSVPSLYTKLLLELNKLQPISHVYDPEGSF
jgi:hypothetical protein